MSRRTYSDSDRARIVAELTINEGNIKRTARTLDVPVSTVRYIKQQMSEGSLPEETLEALPAAFEDKVVQMERIQDKLMVAIEEGLDNGTLKGRELFTGFGIFTDKIRAIRGLDTKKVEHTFELPTTEEVRELFGTAIGEIVGAARDRAAEIEDAEWEPADQALLPSPR